MRIAAVISTSGGTSMNVGSMLPSIGTGHSTKPVTSSSRPSSARSKPSAAASRRACSRISRRAFGRINNHLGGVKLVLVVGEIANFSNQSGARNRWPAVRIVVESEAPFASVRSNGTGAP